MEQSNNIDWTPLKGEKEALSTNREEYALADLKEINESTTPNDILR